MKVIIAGSRGFEDYEYLKKQLNLLIEEGYLTHMSTIVSGGARGADRLGELFAAEYQLKTVLFPADWDQYGPSAGPIRNEQMADYADVLVAFWDGKSRGTQNMIELMQARRKELHVFQCPR